MIVTPGESESTATQKELSDRRKHRLDVPRVPGERVPLNLLRCEA